ncbi:unnamed protein product [Spirodela intermedia]|uniref:Protein kinase domain-containing protein n=1 Tax=Spirodela intermedia TaxID=51605 RepID=A0A7I8J393_SPIIN|nr:unnamed protein product [Spirodela intermedia]CAA6664273.1 unnamed protein product [Spirodela intermedia]
MATRKPTGGAGLLLGAILAVVFLAGLAATQQTSAGDAAAMRAVAQGLLGAVESLGWSVGGNPCEWRFVSCSGGRVTAIQIGNRSVAGELSPAIRNLTALVRLELQDNRIAGPLPSLAGLAALQILILHGNLFSSAVNLDGNPFAPWEIPRCLTDAAALVNFSANSANVSGEIPDFFPPPSGALRDRPLLQPPPRGDPGELCRGCILADPLVEQPAGDPRLSGAVAVVANMTSLTQLWLHSNEFSGPLPDFSGLAAMEDLQLRDNRFSGPVPSSLLSLPALKKVTLANNLFQGPVPVFPEQSFCRPVPGDCDPRVTALLLIAGSFGWPRSFAEGWKKNDPCARWPGITCSGDGEVTVVSLRKRGLSGSISPEFARLKSLRRILLGGNNITGTIPASLAALPALEELDVSDNQLSGRVPAFRARVLVTTAGNPGIGNDGGGGAVPSSRGSNASAADEGGAAPSAARVTSPSTLTGAIAGSLAGGVLGVALFGLFCLYKRKHRHSGRVESPSAAATLRRQSDMLKLSPSGDGGGGMLIPIEVLREVTGGFSEERVLGRGGFGTVAVKRMEAAAAAVAGCKGLREFAAEIEVLTRVRHRNLVSLLGYCLDGGERILVYEYMQQGTLAKHLLHWKEEGVAALCWKRRVAIALDVARGVEYLHSLAHRSFDMKAKVADFGLVRPAAAAAEETRLAGTFGVTTKADVFSFGVILMEMVTGRRALDESRPEENAHLVEWFRRVMQRRRGRRVEELVDPAIELDGETAAGVERVCELAGHCCSHEPMQRPEMGHAVNVLSSLAESWRPVDSDGEETCGIDLTMTLPQALMRWQACEDDDDEDIPPTVRTGADDYQSSVPTGPAGFANSTSPDGR